MHSESPGIMIHNAQLIYHQKTLFKNLNCTIKAASITSFLGPSGIGKSSLLRLIAGLESHTEKLAGTITASDNLPLSGRIAYMAQEDLLLPWLSLINNVLLGYRLRKQLNDTVYQFAHTLLKQVGLGPVIHQYPYTLSGGMRQRAALVRTFLEEKPIVLMDEPFSALDTVTKRKLHELLLTLLANKTVVFITHDPMEALRISDEIYVMSGQPVQISKPMKLSGTKPRTHQNHAQLLEDENQLLKLIEAAHQVNIE